MDNDETWDKMSTVKGIPNWLLADIVKANKEKKLRNGDIFADIAPPIPPKKKSAVENARMRHYSNWGTELSSKEKKHNFRMQKVMKNMFLDSTDLFGPHNDEAGPKPAKFRKPMAPKSGKRSVSFIRRNGDTTSAPCENEIAQAQEDLLEEMAMANKMATARGDIEPQTDAPDLIENLEAHQLDSKQESFSAQIIEAKKKLLAFVFANSYVRYLRRYQSAFYMRNRNSARKIQREFRVHQKKKRRLKIKAMFFLPLQYVIYLRCKRKEKARDCMVAFLTDQLEMGMYRALLKRYIIKIKVCQRHVRSFLVVSRARQHAIEVMWESIEKVYRKQYEERDQELQQRMKRELERRIQRGDDNGVHVKWSLINSQVETLSLHINKVEHMWLDAKVEEEIIMQEWRAQSPRPEPPSPMQSPRQSPRNPVGRGGGGVTRYSNDGGGRSSPPTISNFAKEFGFRGRAQTAPSSVRPSARSPPSPPGGSPLVTARKQSVASTSVTTQQTRQQLHRMLRKAAAMGGEREDWVSVQERRDVIRKHLLLKRRTFIARMYEKYGRAGRRTLSVVTSDHARKLLLQDADSISVLPGGILLPQDHSNYDREKVDEIVEAQLALCFQMAQQERKGKRGAPGIPGLSRPKQVDNDRLFHPFTDQDLGKSWKQVIEESIRKDFQAKKAALLSSSGLEHEPQSTYRDNGTLGLQDGGPVPQHILLRPELGGRYLRTAGGTVYNLHGAKGFVAISPEKMRATTR